VRFFLTNINLKVNVSSPLRLTAEAILMNFGTTQNNVDVTFYCETALGLELGTVRFASIPGDFVVVYSVLYSKVI
jgi:hypothetical protein